MAYWGKAWTSNVNYNKPVCLEPEDATAREAAIMAKKVAAEFGKDWEKALCDAMYLRHVVEGHPEVVRKDPSGRDILNKAYAEAMQSVYDKFYLPSYDPDIAAITAEAHMQLSPWKLWPYHPGVNDAEHFTHATDIPTLTSHILNILESGFNDRESNKHHTGLVHFWIHVWEMSPTPERGLPLANWLRTSTLGGAGHLAHMPSHLDVLCGRYKEAVRSNELALEADHRFLEYRPQTFYNAYIQHGRFHRSRRRGMKELIVLRLVDLLVCSPI